MISDVRNGNFPFLLVSSKKMRGFCLVFSSNIIGDLKIFCSGRFRVIICNRYICTVIVSICLWENSVSCF